MLFKVVRKKTGETCDVYSVQMILGHGTLGQSVPVIVFLTYNNKENRWELIEADEFVPQDVKIEPTKSPILG